jgi:hypothetical protein
LHIFWSNVANPAICLYNRQQLFGQLFYLFKTEAAAAAGVIVITGVRVLQVQAQTSELDRRSASGEIDHK